MDHYWYPAVYGHYFFYLRLAHTLSKFTISSYRPLLSIWHIWISNLLILFLFSSIYFLPLIETWLSSSLTSIYWTPVMYNLVFLAPCISPIHWIFTALREPAVFIPSWWSDSDSERLSFLGWRDAASVDWKKKKHNLKVDNYVLFSVHSEDLSLGDRLWDCSEEVREEPGYLGVFATKTR